MTAVPSPSDILAAFEPIIRATALYRERMIDSGFDEQTAAELAVEFHTTMMAQCRADAEPKRNQAGDVLKAFGLA